MKKTNYLLIIAIFSLLFTVPAVIKAEDSRSDDNDTDIQRGRDDSESIKNRIRAELDSKEKNIKNNRDIRNTSLGSTSNSSTSSKNRGDDDDNDDDSKADKRNEKKSESAEKRGEKREENKDRLEFKSFEMKKSNLVRQLNRALENLMQIRERLSSRIVKAEASGRNMTNAKSLLVIADTKIAIAKNAVNSLASSTVSTTTNPTATTTATTTTATTTATSTATTTIIVDVRNHRVMGEAAIKAVNEAKKALNNVVVAIAHSMGLRVGQDGTIATSTTATSTATTTSPTATTTATTTNSTATTTTATTTATSTNSTATTTATSTATTTNQ